MRYLLISFKEVYVGKGYLGYCIVLSSLQNELFQKCCPESLKVCSKVIICIYDLISKCLSYKI